MKPHIELAHNYWKQVVKPHDVIVDATCGNGHDSLVLAKLLNNTGRLYCFDIQLQAIQATKKRLEGYDVVFVHGSHNTLHQVKEPIKLIVYNLGYLPGGDKSITTLHKSTIESLQQAITRAQAISIMCYPGHPEGAIESQTIIEFCQRLDPKKWKVRSHHWPIRERHPHLVHLEAFADHPVPDS